MTTNYRGKPYGQPSGLPGHPQLGNMGQNAEPTVVAKDFYVYQENFDSIANGVSQTGNVNIQADSNFRLEKLTYFATISDAAQTDSTRVIPLVNVQITDSGSGRNLFEEALPIPALFGTGELPFILPTPKIFQARSTITVNISNFSAGSTYRVNLSFVGHKIFYSG